MLKLFKKLKHCKRNALIAMILVALQNIITLALPTVVSTILIDGVDKGNSGYIVLMGAVMCLVALSGMVVGIAANHFACRTSANFGANLRRECFVKITAMSQQEYEKFGTASLITRTTNDIQNLQELIIVIIKILIPAPILFIGGAFLSFIYNAKLATIIFIVLPVIAVIAAIVFKFTSKMFKQQQEKIDTINRIVREKLTGIRVIRAFNRSRSEDERFNESNLQLTNIALKINRIFAVIIPVAYLLLYATLTVIMIIGTNELNTMNAVTQAQQLTEGVYNLQLFMIFLVLMLAGVGMAAAMVVMIPRGVVSAKRINDVLDEEISVKESSNPVSKNEISRERGHLEFKDVKFCYPDAEEPVLQKITFESFVGETTAIIGSTGAGKSTLVNLIPRFFDVNAGEILINGVNIKDIEQNTLRDKIAYIPQKAFLFSGTIADNLRYGKPDASCDEMWKALETAQAGDFVRMMPNQLDSVVSQSGTNLSGGQKQRISIARALIKEAEFLIFDDSFSALDFKTDAELRKALKKYISASNIIIVAQRISTVMDADRIIVLEEGRIAGMGTHRELLKTCRAYKEIALSQLSAEEVSAE